MEFYILGKRENPAILLLPGTGCHWKRNFRMVIPLLERDYCVVCVSYDGFDETEDTVFPDMRKSCTEFFSRESCLASCKSGWTKRPRRIGPIWRKC